MCLVGNRGRKDGESGDVRLQTESVNVAISCMLSASGHNYTHSSVMWTWLWGRYHFPQNVFLVSLLLLLFVVNVSCRVELYV